MIVEVLDSSGDGGETGRECDRERHEEGEGGGEREEEESRNIDYN